MSVENGFSILFQQICVYHVPGCWLVHHELDREILWEEAGHWFSERCESVHGSSDMAVQAMYALKPTPCFLGGACASG